MQLVKEIKELSDEIGKHVDKLIKENEQHDFVGNITEALGDLIAKIIETFTAMKCLVTVLELEDVAAFEMGVGALLFAVFWFDVQHVISALISMAGGSRSEVAIKVEKEVIRPMARQQEKMRSLNDTLSKPTKDQ